MTPCGMVWGARNTTADRRSARSKFEMVSPKRRLRKTAGCQHPESLLCRHCVSQARGKFQVFTRCAAPRLASTLRSEAAAWRGHRRAGAGSKRGVRPGHARPADDVNTIEGTEVAGKHNATIRPKSRQRAR